MSPQERVVARFVEAINAHDVDAMLGLATSDHRYIDGAGQVLTGEETLRRAWMTYFEWMPDYRIEVENVLSGGPVVALFGVARGTYAPDGILQPENRWAVPAAWRARVRGDRVAEWQVYVDNDAVSRIMERYRHGYECV